MDMGRLVVVGTFLGFVSMALGCGDDAEQESVECCMLKQLASRCESPNSTASLMESVREWRDVGNSGNAAACKAMIESKDNGCSGPTLDYDEQDAIVDCS